MKKERTMFKLFGPKGEKILGRHKFNARKLTSSVKSFTSGILQFGYMAEMRSFTMCTDHDVYMDMPGSGLAFAGASGLESCYAACELQPDNPHCQQIINEGIPGSLWDGDMPEDVVCWVKNEANGFMYGSQFTFLEMYALLALNLFLIWLLCPEQLIA